MSNTANNSPKKEKAANLFPVGPAGRRELRNELKATTNPARTIAEFQQTHSLHTMVSKALGTVPQHKFRATRNAGNPETLDTDSVMKFLSHLGVSQHEVHKRISDSLLKQLVEAIRNTKEEDALLKLLRDCWFYATTISELRPILWAILKELGEKVPKPVLQALTERDNGMLKHAEIFDKLTMQLKRLCWESDWDDKIPIEYSGNPNDYLALVQPTLLYQTFVPYIDEYMNNKDLKDLANRVFVANPSERRMITSGRRALAKSDSARAAKSDTPRLTSGNALSSLRGLIGETTSSLRRTASQRPKLMYAVLTILMARHASVERPFLGGETHLHCTLVADLLLSTGGSLPKAYTNLLSLASTLDEIVQEGKIGDQNIVKLQECIKQIYQVDKLDETLSAKKLEKKTDSAASMALKRQLNQIITAGIVAMKECDSKQTFLNPVTADVARDYAEKIPNPMCIRMMEDKVENNEYNDIEDWKADFSLMIDNCFEYNGKKGWYAEEARRQATVFGTEIYPPALARYRNEVAKRELLEDTSSKRKREDDGPVITPLAAATKKRKKEREDYIPSMPALAAMLLCDPFVVRVLLARVLREIRGAVTKGKTLPFAHSTLPTLLQILQMALWSHKTCFFPKKFLIPSAGLQEAEGMAAVASYSSLRRYIPLLVRMLLENDLDKSLAPGGDLYHVSQSGFDFPLPSLDLDEWIQEDNLDVAAAVVQGMLVELCQGAENRNALVKSFPRLMEAVKRVSASILDARPFFVSLSGALLRHKSKIPQDAQEAIVGSWCDVLRAKGSMSSFAHEKLVELLNEWMSMGNKVLPRNTLIKFSVGVVKSTESDGTSFVGTWKSESADFGAVKKQYERMLKNLPEQSAAEWREQVGFEAATEAIDVNNNKADVNMEVDES